MNSKNSNSSDESNEKQITFDEVSDKGITPSSECETDWTFFVQSMWVVIEVCIVVLGLFYMIHKGILVEVALTGTTMHIILNVLGVEWKPWK